jgi:hypothetical protein
METPLTETIFALHKRSFVAAEPVVVSFGSQPADQLKQLGSVNFNNFFFFHSTAKPPQQLSKFIEIH